MVDCLSRLEADFCVLLEMSPNVLAFQLMAPRSRRAATPVRSGSRYFEMTLADGSEQCAVLRREGSVPGRIRAPLEIEPDAPIAIAASSIRQEPRLQNLRRLAHYLPPHLPRADACRRAVQLLHREAATSMHEAAKAVGQATLSALLAAGYAWCSLDQCIRSETKIGYAAQPHDDWFFVSQGHGF